MYFLESLAIYLEIDLSLLKETKNFSQQYKYDYWEINKFFLNYSWVVIWPVEGVVKGNKGIPSGDSNPQESNTSIG